MTSMSHGRRSIAFGTYLLCWILLSLGALRALAKVATENAPASHTILIPIVTLVLLYHRRRSIAAVAGAGRAANVLGAVVVLIGVAFTSIASLDRASGAQTVEGDSLTVTISGFVLGCLGGFLLFYGKNGFRAALFPLLFLAFMIPIPNILLDATIQMLRIGSAEAVSALFAITVTPFHREGFVFVLPAVAIEIGDGCSGIRSSIALMLTSLLAADGFLKTPWKKALLVAAAVPVAVVKNGIRIAALSLLATYVDPTFLTGHLHHEGGMVFFLIAVILMVPLLVALRDSDVMLSRGVS